MPKAGRWCRVPFPPRGNTQGVYVADLYTHMIYFYHATLILGKCRKMCPVARRRGPVTLALDTAAYIRTRRTASACTPIVACVTLAVDHSLPRVSLIVPSFTYPGGTQ